MSTTTVDHSNALRAAPAVEQDLQAILADFADLHSQVKQAHWNLQGPQFIPLHSLLDELADRLTEWLDEVAERITALDGIVRGTLRQAVAASRLPEPDADQRRDMAWVATLTAAYTQVALALREAISRAEDAGDAGSADLFTALSQGVDKDRWLLKSHIVDA